MSGRAVRAGRAEVEVSIRDRVSKGLKGIERKMRNFSAGLQSMGSKVAGAGAAVAAGFSAPLLAVGSAFAAFDAQMAEVGAISGAVGEDFDTLRAKAKELGSTTRFSASEAAAGMKFLGMAGMSTAEIMQAIGPVLDLAAAGNLDLALASDIASDATTAFGLTAADTARVVDVMAKTATASNTSVEQMGEAFTYAAAQGAAAGQTVEDVSAALGILGNAGLKASIAGTGVQGLFKRMIGEGSGKLSELGVAINDASGRILPLATIIEDLRQKTQNLTQIERLKAFEEIFGLHSKTAVILTENSEALADLTNTLKTSQGAAGELASKMSDNLYGSFLKLKSAVEGVILSLGEGLKGPATWVMDTFASIAGQITRVLEANKPLVQILAAVSIGLAAAGAAATVFGVAIVALGTTIAAVLPIISAAGAVIGMLTWPVVAIGAAIAAGIGATMVWAGALGYVAAQAGIFDGALQFLRRTFGDLLKTGKDTFSGIMDALQAGQYMLAARILWAGLKVAFWRGAEAVADIFEHLWQNLWSMAKSFFSTLVSKIVSVFKSLPGLLYKVLSGATSMQGALAQILSGNLDVSDFAAGKGQVAQQELDALRRQAMFARYSQEGPRQDAPAWAPDAKQFGPGVLSPSPQAEAAAKRQAEREAKAAMEAAKKAADLAVAKTEAKRPTKEKSKLAETPELARSAGAKSATLSALGTTSAAAVGAGFFGTGGNDQRETARNTGKLTRQMQKLLLRPQPGFGV